MLIFRAFNHAAAKAVLSVVQNGVLSFGYGALFFFEFDMHAAAVLYANADGLVGLTVTEFCHAVELFCLRFNGNPIKINHLARLGVKRALVAVGNVEDVVL